MTKEEILNQRTGLSVDPRFGNNGDILEAMDEYAKTIAIEFAEFMYNRFQQIRYNSKKIGHVKTLSPGEKEYTTEQLFDLFLSQRPNPVTNLK